MIALSIYRSPIILSSLRFISKTAQNLTSAFVFLCALPSPGLLATCSSGNLHIHVILQNFFFFYSTLQRCRTFKFSDWNTDFLMPSSVYLWLFSLTWLHFWSIIKYYYIFFAMLIFWIHYLLIKSSSNILSHDSKCLGVRITKPHWNK